MVRFLYVQKKAFRILGLKWLTGRPWPAAAVTPAPGEALETRVSAEPGGRTGGSPEMAAIRGKQP
jgi:hypothetical protein